MCAFDSRRTLILLNLTHLVQLLVQYPSLLLRIIGHPSLYRMLAALASAPPRFAPTSNSNDDCFCWCIDLSLKLLLLLETLKLKPQA